MKIDLYSVKGVKTDSVDMPSDLIREDNPRLLAQSLHIYNDRSHFHLSMTKTRSDVNRTKKKLYKQKGTGGARHGARSAHIFVGGGTVHGPHGVSRVLTLPQKMKVAAKATALGAKLKQGRLFLVDGLKDIKKTKDAASLISTLGTNIKRVAVLVPSSTSAYLAFRNLEGVTVNTFADANAKDIYFGGTVLLDSSFLPKVSSETKTKKTVKTVKKVSKK